MWYASSMGTIVLATKKYDENEQLERTHTHEAEEIPQSSNCFCSSIHILLCLRYVFSSSFFCFWLFRLENDKHNVCRANAQAAP